MHELCHKLAAHSGADLAPRSCRHHNQSHPNNWSISDRSKCSEAWSCCTFRSWSWTAELLPPQSWLPHVATDPSARIAAKAPAVDWTCCTFWSWSWTAKVLPPQSLSPHVITDLSAKMAANACCVAWTELHVLKPIFDCRAVTRAIWMAPCNNWSIS